MTTILILGVWLLLGLASSFFLVGTNDHAYHNTFKGPWFAYPRDYYHSYAEMQEVFKLQGEVNASRRIYCTVLGLVSFVIMLIYLVLLLIDYLYEKYYRRN